MFSDVYFWKNICFALSTSDLYCTGVCLSSGCPLSERSGGVPGYCVSYATAGPAGTVSTDVVQNSSCPVWDHQQESL